MANSPLITMPLLNGLSMYDFGLGPNPSNIFGNISLGVDISYQDVPCDLIFYSPRLVSNNASILEDCRGEMSDLKLSSLDFYSIYDPSIISSRELPGRIIGGGSFPTKQKSFLLTTTKTGEYGEVLKACPPSYGEARPNFSVYIRVYRDIFPGKFQVWEIVVSKLPSFKFACPIIAYSRFAKPKITNFLWLKQVEYPVEDGIRSNYYYGVAESAEMVPILWGATPLNPIGAKACLVENFDIYYYHLFKAGLITDFNSMKTLWRQLYTVNDRDYTFVLENNTLNVPNGTGYLSFYYSLPVLLWASNGKKNVRQKTAQIIADKIIYNSSVYIARKFDLKIDTFTISGCSHGLSRPEKIQYCDLFFLNFCGILANVFEKEKNWYLDYPELLKALKGGFVPPGIINP